MVVHTYANMFSNHIKRMGKPWLGTNRAVIDISEKAVERIKYSLADRPDCCAVRVSVVTSGCGGYAYHLEYALENSDPEDTTIEKDGAVIVIDPKSLVHLVGTRLDYEKVGLNEGYQFVNPNVSGKCGCGESFYYN